MRWECIEWELYNFNISQTLSLLNLWFPHSQVQDHYFSVRHHILNGPNSIQGFPPVIKWCSHQDYCFAGHEVNAWTSWYTRFVPESGCVDFSTQVRQGMFICFLAALLLVPVWRGIINCQVQTVNMNCGRDLEGSRRSSNVNKNKQLVWLYTYRRVGRSKVDIYDLRQHKYLPTWKVSR